MDTQLQDKLLSEVKQAVNSETDSQELKELLSKLVLEFDKNLKWLDKLARLSDKQQEKLRKLNEQSKNEQKLAYQKQVAMIVNDFARDERFDIQVVYVAADILSGDTYSIYKTKNGGALIYLIDVMGHGLPPSLTSFAVSSLIKQSAQSVDKLDDLLEILSYFFETMLVDEEQISGSFFWFDSAFKSLDYAMGGMHPAVLQDNGSVIMIGSNNPPAMNFMARWETKTIALDGFQKLAVYSDGLVEGDYFPKIKANIELLLNSSDIDEVEEIAKKHSPEDDLTVILFERTSRE
jgi:serine phosphatase RsbU (regulator of sigma subunit)